MKPSPSNPSRQDTTFRFTWGCFTHNKNELISGELTLGFFVARVVQRVSKKKPGGGKPAMLGPYLVGWWDKNVRKKRGIWECRGSTVHGSNFTIYHVQVTGGKNFRMVDLQGTTSTLQGVRRGGS